MATRISLLVAKGHEPQTLPVALGSYDSVIAVCPALESMARTWRRRRSALRRSAESFLYGAPGELMSRSVGAQLPDERAGAMALE